MCICTNTESHTHDTTQSRKQTHTHDAHVIRQEAQRLDSSKLSLSSSDLNESVSEERGATISIDEKRNTPHTHTS